MESFGSHEIPLIETKMDNLQIYQSANSFCTTQSIYLSIFKFILSAKLHWKWSMTLYIKYLWKRCVFRLLLKADMLLHSLIFCGRLFHNLGAAHEKDRSPKVTNLLLGWTNSRPSADLRLRTGWWILTKSFRYSGAASCRHLNTSRSIQRLHLGFVLVGVRQWQVWVIIIVDSKFGNRF